MRERVRHLRPGMTAVALTAAMLGLAGCGSAPPAAPPAAVPTVATTAAADPEPSPAAAATPTTTATATATPTAAASRSSSFGVERHRWPTTAKSAKAVLDALPRTFAGHQRETYSAGAEEDTGATAGAEYGDKASVSVSEEDTTSDTEGGSSQRMSARDVLVASFMLGLACADGSYAGNALPRGDAAAPKVPAGKPAWFSCAVDQAEGDEDFTAQAVGWTSGRTAWLVIAPDQKGARALVTALEAA